MRTIKSILTKMSAVLLLLLILSGCEHEQSEDIIILYTNDVASTLDGNLTYAQVKGYKDKLLSENKYVSLVDAGDFLDGPASQYSKGQYIVELMNAVGYDYVTLGNQEFSIGLDVLKESIAGSAFKYTSCNLRFLGGWLEPNPLKEVKPYYIHNYGGTKVAFIGVTTPETLSPGKPAYEAIADENGELLYDFYQEEDGQALYKQVQKTVNKVRNKVDYVIVISHLGQNSVTEGYSSLDLIANTSGIDVVIDGHSHTPNTGEMIANIEGTNVVLTSAQEKLEYLGELRLHPNHTYTTVLYSYIYESDPDVEALTEAIKAQINS